MSTCMEGSFFTAYKCSEEGVTSYAATAKAVFTNMTLIDNHIGAALNGG